MKTRHHSNKSKSGGVLLMAMLVMLAFSFLAVGLFHMSTGNAVETVYADHSKQAFWAAESGVQDAIQRLRYDSTFRTLASNGSRSFPGTNGVSGTRYDVTVTYTGGDRVFENFEFDVDSVGWKNTMNRRIRQHVSTRPGFFSAIMAPGNIHVGQNTLVSGPIAVMDGGTLEMDDRIPPGSGDERDFDTVILGDGASIDRRSGAREDTDYATANLPVPELPTLPDDPAYHDLVQAAAATTNTTPPAADFDFGAIQKDVYYNIPSGITLNTISGSGRIINTGPITITEKLIKSDTDVSSDVGLVSGDYIDVGPMNGFSGDTLLYADTYVVFDDHSFASAQSVILAAGSDASGMGITMGGQSQFEGIVFAQSGSVIIESGSGGDNNTRITGTVISGTDIVMGQNSEVIFDYSVFNEDLFPLAKFFKTGVIAIKRKWEELPPL